MGWKQDVKSNDQNHREKRLPNQELVGVRPTTPKVKVLHTHKKALGKKIPLKTRI